MQMTSKWKQLVPTTDNSFHIPLQLAVILLFSNECNEDEIIKFGTLQHDSFFVLLITHKMYTEIRQYQWNSIQTKKTHKRKFLVYNRKVSSPSPVTLMHITVQPQHHKAHKYHNFVLTVYIKRPISFIVMEVTNCWS